MLGLTSVDAIAGELTTHISSQSTLVSVLCVNINTHDSSTRIQKPVRKSPANIDTASCSCGSVEEHYVIISAKGHWFNSQETHLLMKMYSLNAL